MLMQKKNKKNTNKKDLYAHHVRFIQSLFFPFRGIQSHLSFLRRHLKRNMRPEWARANGFDICANVDAILMTSIKTGYIAPISCEITENQSMCRCARHSDDIFIHHDTTTLNMHTHTAQWICRSDIHMQR